MKSKDMCLWDYDWRCRDRTFQPYKSREIIEAFFFNNPVNGAARFRCRQEITDYSNQMKLGIVTISYRPNISDFMWY